MFNNSGSEKIFKSLRWGGFGSVEPLARSHTLRGTGTPISQILNLLNFMCYVDTDQKYTGLCL